VSRFDLYVKPEPRPDTGRLQATARGLALLLVFMSAAALWLAWAWA